MRILPNGDLSLLVELPDLETMLGLHSVLADDPPPGVVDVVPAARTLTLLLDRAADPATVAAAVRGARPRPPAARPGDTVEIPVVYDGEDLAEVADATGLTPAEVVAAHTGTPWRVAFTGFAPGFGYLVGGDPRLNVPRRSVPRVRVPAGAVGLAGEFSGIYPVESPGGWQLIGRTDVPMWDLDRVPPALLRPGVEVRFVASDTPPETPPLPRTTNLPTLSTPEACHTREARTGPGEPEPNVPTGPAPETRGGTRDEVGAEGTGARGASVRAPVGRALEVVAAGPLATVQDLGRAGNAALGVGAAGAADPEALRLANRAVGNPEDAAAIEVTLGGFAARCHGGAFAVVTGAPAPLTVDGRAVAPYSVFPVPDGAEVRMGPPPSGLRSYLAVRGGVAVPPVLGSRSTDTLSGVGPEPVRPGTLLPVGEPPEAAPFLDVLPVGRPAEDEITLRVRLGPRDDWFTGDAVAALLAEPYTVTSEIDRVGMRLDGPPLARARSGELPSEGMVTGALQVPPSGRPVLFLADHPLTGGYPVIAVVVAADVPRAAQARPGQRLRFRPDRRGT
ncbi:KipI family sensor histidine kinase inhibitor [Actinomadura namibiensis]|uniref:KipI family sensor histidine kinase inhibitor n=1 Tax=Actinomadura namibiensis TaxID=182080 RepID=A0A7W3QM06_ACTNM|nr:KipI family sensor histidine kinase inhibitor [Actinomadura namibiensis]